MATLLETLPRRDDDEKAGTGQAERHLHVVEDPEMTRRRELAKKFVNRGEAGRASILRHVAFWQEQSTTQKEESLIKHAEVHLEAAQQLSELVQAELGPQPEEPALAPSISYRLERDGTRTPLGRS